jgi:hypothetical protein
MLLRQPRSKDQDRLPCFFGSHVQKTKIDYHASSAATFKDQDRLPCFFGSHVQKTKTNYHAPLVEGGIIEIFADSGTNCGGRIAGYFSQHFSSL